MSSGPWRCKPGAVKAAVAALVAAGVEVARVEVEKDGTIVVVAGKTAPSPAGDDLDQELKKFGELYGQG